MTPLDHANVPTRTNVLGVGVSAINLTEAAHIVDTWIEKREKHYVCVTGVHGVMESQRDPGLRAIHNAAGMVTPDGMPMVWLSKLQGHGHASRVYGPDLMLKLCEQSETKGYRHYFYGGAEGVADLLAERLQQKFPKLEVVGTYCPPFRALTEQEEIDIAAQINEATPDIVWVGLSTPKQERWMAKNRTAVEAPVMLGVGAAFDFHAGLKQQAPLWMQRNGLEWFFRMVTEPRRLGGRYLRNNPEFVSLILAQKLGLKAYELE